MRVLVIDTSLPCATVALVRLEDRHGYFQPVDYAHVFLRSRPGHAEQLLERVTLVLESTGVTLSDVDLLVLGRGPGTFTGLRIGFATAKGLHLASGIPLVAVSSLSAIACSAHLDGTVLSLMDARRGELYMGLFRVRRFHGVWQAEPLGDERVVRPADVPEVLAAAGVALPVFPVGDGVTACGDVLGLPDKGPSPCATAPDVCAMAVAGAQIVAERGPDNAALLEPVYLREPDAKLPAGSIQGPMADTGK